MKILDKVAIIIGIVGVWLYVSGVDSDVWGHVVLGAVIAIIAFIIGKVSDYIADRREEQEEWEEERRSKTFSAWMHSSSLR
ncbi:hypothetical protein ACTNEY_15095 [Fusicatenibacter saccharivorans]|uniref:hypothetical protein n=1 Tax=Fusicatenibacter saccharivorans TaxID=1150298 RepID=UPI003F8B1004